MSNAAICNEVSERNINAKSVPAVSSGRLIRALKAARELWRSWQRNSVTRRELAGMSNHMLKDIGISRADAMAEASKPFWRC